MTKCPTCKKAVKTYDGADGEKYAKHFRDGRYFIGAGPIRREQCPSSFTAVKK